MELKRLTLSIVVVSALAIGPAALDAHTGLNLGASAEAKNGKGGGNGGGRSSSSGGNSGGNSSSAGGSSSNSSNSSKGGSSNSGSFASSDSKGGWGSGGRKANDSSWGNSRGAIASKLGALNAAHASATARLNASPNSRVGLIAAYEQAVNDGIQLSADYADAKGALQILLDDQQGTLSDSEYDSIEALNAAISDIQNQSDLLDQERSALTSGEPIGEAELAALAEKYNVALETVSEVDGEEQVETRATEEIIADILSEISAAQDALPDTTELEALAAEYNAFNDQIASQQTELEKLEAQTASQAQTEVDTLELAANKTLSPDVVDEVNRLLGIESAFREPGAELPTEEEAPAES